ncbi:MAG TPA: hypothetical protein VHZ51_01715 [Ktedonobacteraceae bacterium]|nr:hypothetical protein [Ktedonobacteraceae bacterium]
MILHKGERVFWGSPEVIYLEGPITALDADEQTVVVHIERATPHSAHLIGANVPFNSNGVKPLNGDSPPGTTSERTSERVPPPAMSDDEKVQRAASVAVHEQYGYKLPAQQEESLVKQVAEALNKDAAMRSKIITSMDEILKREF